MHYQMNARAGYRDMCRQYTVTHRQDTVGGGVLWRRHPGNSMPSEATFSSSGLNRSGFDVIGYRGGGGGAPDSGASGAIVEDVAPNPFYTHEFRRSAAEHTPVGLPMNKLCARLLLHSDSFIFV